MKKARNIVSYLVVLALLTSVLSGLSLKTQDVKADSITKTFNVLEIVPDEDMGTFKYLLDGDLSSDVKGNTNARNFLTDNKLGKFSGSNYTSENYFVKEVLPKKINIGGTMTDVTWTVSLTTKTPNNVTVDQINNADFIVISESIPTALNVKNKNKHFYDNDFPTEIAWAIFTRIAGVENKPIPYIIDHSIYTSVSSNSTYWKDARELNANMRGSNDAFAYVKADDLDGMSESWNTVGQFDKDPNKNKGSRLNCYKLYKMLSCINPATLYGLYCTDTDDSYGIDKDLNLIINGSDKDRNAYGYMKGVKISAWGDNWFGPYYMVTSSKDVGNIKNKMGWTDASSRPSDPFVSIIGGDSAEKGSGMVFNGSGIFGCFGINAAGGVDLSEYKEYDDLDVNYSGTSPWNNQIDIINRSTASDITGKWRISVKISGLVAIRVDNNNSNIQYERSGDVITFYSDKTLAKNNGKVSIIGGFQGDYPFVYSKVTKSVSEGLDITNIIGSFYNTEKNDYHPYKYLVKYGSSVHSTLNRSLVADMVAKANEYGKGLVGGIIIENVSDAGAANIYDINRIYDDVITGGSADEFVNKFDTQMKNSSNFGIMYHNSPIEYYTSQVPNYENFNYQNYYSGNAEIEVENDANYINYMLLDSAGKPYNVTDEDGNTKIARAASTLDFNFEILGGSGDFYSRVYIDANHDDIFEDAFYSGTEYTYDSKDLDIYIENKLYSEVLVLSNGGNVVNKSLDLIGKGKILGEDFSGGFAWKLVITDKSSKKSVVKIGISAIKNTSGNLKKINVLQIIPTNYISNMGAPDAGNTTDPVVVLPTKAEIQAARNKRSKPIAEYDVDEHTENYNGTGFYGILGYFDKCITVDTCNSLPTNTTVKKDSVGTYTYKLNDGRKSGPVMTAGIIQYFLDNLGDYDMNVFRYSVYEFNQQMNGTGSSTSPKLTYNPSNSSFTVKDSSTVKYNIDKSIRYLYSASSLGLGDKWYEEEIAADSGMLPKYLVDSDATSEKRIYGRRDLIPQYESDGKTPKKDSDGNILYTTKYKTVYYSSRENGVNGVTTPGEAEIDLLILGFSSNMDYFSTTGLNVIESYLKADKPAFIGHGVSVKGASNNNLGERIRPIIGMSEEATGEGSSNINGTIGTYMLNNNTLFSHYPYKVLDYFTGTKDLKQNYKLALTTKDDAGNNVSNNIVVTYSKYSKNAGNGYGNWGDVAENYYLYKKGAITFCGFGNSFMDVKPVSSVTNLMTMPQVMMFVNALVTSAKSGTDGITDDPYFKCIDVDSSCIGGSGQEDDEFGLGGFVGKYIGKDAVYTDYDYVSAADNSRTSVASILPIQSESVVPEGYILYNSDYTLKNMSEYISNDRWIPYQVRTTAADGYLYIWDVPLDLYLYDSEPLPKKENGSIKLDSNGHIEYQFKEDGTPKYETQEVNGKLRDIKPDNKVLIKLQGEWEYIEEKVGDVTYKRYYMKYPVSKKNKYYLVTPLSNSSSKYSGKSSTESNYNKDKSSLYGFVFSSTDPRDKFDIELSLYVNGGEIEHHTLSVIRRMLYPIK